jgi:hypothetical protein
VVERHLSLEQALDLLPRVRKHLSAALQMHIHLRRLAEQLVEADIDVSTELLSGEEEFETDDEDVLRVYAMGRAMYDGVRERLQALDELGVAVEDLGEGIVEFRSLMDGRTEVVLCWKLGEPTIRHWHAVDEAWSDRRLLGRHVFVASADEAKPRGDADRSAAEQPHGD